MRLLVAYVIIITDIKKKALKRYGDHMLRVLDQTEDIKSFNIVRDEFPYSRILMRIASLDDSEGQPVAVSDFVDSNDDLYEKLHEYLEKDILCVIIGSYVQGENEMLYTVSDDRIFTVNRELYILEKRNAAMQFIIDTGAGIMLQGERTWLKFDPRGVCCK